MIGGLFCAALICALSALVGEAACRLCGRAPWRGYAPAVGFAGVILAVSAAVKLPGEAVTSLVALIALSLAAALALGRRWVKLQPPSPALAAALAATLLFACLPFLANGRFGLLGVNFYNDPAAHLAWTLNLLGDPYAADPAAGYPLGPHALLATLVEATGVELDSAFAGLLLVAPLLTVPAALSLLKGLNGPARALAAVLTAFCYLAAAYYIQSSFKEPLVALLVLGALGLLRELSREGGSPLGAGVLFGLLLAGGVVLFSYSAPAWIVGAAAIWALLELVFRQPAGTRQALARARAALPGATRAVGVAALVAAVALLPEIGRLADYLGTLGVSPSQGGVIAKSNIGSLDGPIPVYEVLGLWPIEDWRFSIDAFRKGALAVLGLGVALYGALWWLRRRDFVLPAAVAAAALIYLALRERESAYIAAKALVVAAPLLMLMGTRALFDRLPIGTPFELRAVRAIAAVAFVGAALWSSFLVLRGGQVDTGEQPGELASLRATVAGRPTLFLGNDDYAGWYLSGLPLRIAAGAGVTGSPPAFNTRREKDWDYGEPFDFDSIRPKELDTVDYVITTRTRFASEPPANFRLTKRTPSFLLWRRQGPTPARLTLAEDWLPGRTLDCSGQTGRRLARRSGWARVRPRPRYAKVPTLFVPLGGQGSRTIQLPAGRWELSLETRTPQTLRVAGGGLSTTLAPNLARPGPLWRVGELVLARAAPVGLVFSPESPGPLRPRSQLAIVDGIAAVRTDAPPRLVPLRRACGLYVDWYTLGPRKPPT